jgi:hypothetical protein
MAELFMGAPWSVVVGKDEAGSSEEDDEPMREESDENAGKKPGVLDAKDAATWRVLGLPLTSVPTSEGGESGASEASDSDHEKVGTTKAADAMDTIRELAEDAGTPEPASANLLHETKAAHAWLDDEFATITAGPVVVPPLTLITLQQWAATTPRPSRFLPVHPWLYGLLPDKEGYLSSASHSVLRSTFSNIAMKSSMVTKTQTKHGNVLAAVSRNFHLSVLNFISRHSGMSANGWLIQRSSDQSWLTSMVMNGRTSSNHPIFGLTR